MAGGVQAQISDLQFCGASNTLPSLPFVRCKDKLDYPYVVIQPARPALALEAHYEHWNSSISANRDGNF